MIYPSIYIHPTCVSILLTLKPLVMNLLQAIKKHQMQEEEAIQAAGH